MARQDELAEDGNLDVLTGGTLIATATLFYGNGDGTLAPPQSYVMPIGGIDVAIADYNSDGISDATVINGFGANNITVLINTGAQ